MSGYSVTWLSGMAGTCLVGILLLTIILLLSCLFPVNTVVICLGLILIFTGQGIASLTIGSSSPILVNILKWQPLNMLNLMAQLPDPSYQKDTYLSNSQLLAGIIGYSGFFPSNWLLALQTQTSLERGDSYASGTISRILQTVAQKINVVRTCDYRGFNAPDAYNLRRFLLVGDGQFWVESVDFTRVDYRWCDAFLNGISASYHLNATLAKHQIGGPFIY